MSTLWSIVVTFWANLPWVAVALAAVVAWLRRKESKALMLQVVGAGGYFALVIAEWVVLWLLQLTGATANIQRGAGVIFSFLLFVALVLFAVGYCMEKLRRHDAGGVSVVATPVK